VGKQAIRLDRREGAQQLRMALPVKPQLATSGAGDARQLGDLQRHDVGLVEPAQEADRVAADPFGGRRAEPDRAEQRMGEGAFRHGAVPEE
jgi:hypothetical protein